MKKYTLTLLFLIVQIGVSLSQDFEVAPSSLDFNVDPGESQTKNLTIKNHGNKPVSIVLTLRDYIVYKDGQRKILPAESSKNSLAKWITLNPSFMNINPNESMTAQVNFQAPNDDYTSKWGILSVSPAKQQTSFSADKELQTGIGVYGRIDVNLSYTPTSKGNTEKRVKISNLKEIESTEESIRKFSVHIDNLGNTLTDCKIYLIASNLNTLEEKKFNSKKITAYPQSTRTVELSLPANKLKKGKYALSAILDYGSNEALEGTQITIEVE
jgi:hypothetical protein